MFSPLLRGVLLALLILVTAAPAADAAPDQLSFMMDDDELLYSGDRERGRALVQMKSIGVDAVRVTVLWRTVARGVNPRSKRFDADDPSTYPTRNWDRYDGVVQDAQRNGLKVLFNVTGPGPSWGHRRAPRSQRANRITYKPYAGRFAAFVEAVGRRYSGRYRDENGARAILPRVGLWSIWNEPNQAGWLSPQWERRGRTMVASAAHQYRDLYQLGQRALKTAGHGADTVLLGETAPSGSSRRSARSPMRPGLFLRELLCTDSKGRRLRGASAKRRGCKDFSRRGPLRTGGFAHHPYTKDRAPNRRPSHRDDRTLANIDTLVTQLDGLAKSTGGRLPSGLPLLMTEFGFETDPPDPHHGTSLERQARYLQLGEFMAYQHPRVKAMTQFLLRDVPPVRKHKKGSKAYWATYQSGILDRNGKPKPAAFAYAMPFVGFPAGAGTVGFWGQLRFRPNGRTDTVQLQWRPGGGQGAWAALGAPATADALGYYRTNRPQPAPDAEYRAVYLNPATGAVELASLSTDA